MSGFLLRILAIALLVMLVALELPGLFVDTLGALLVAALVVGLANGILRPVFARRGWPMKGFWLIGAALLVNMIVPALLMKLLPGFRVDSALQAAAALLLLSASSAALSKVVQDR